MPRTMRALPAFGVLLITLAGCGRQTGTGRLDVSVIGTRLDSSMPARGTLTSAQSVLADVTRQGLVRLDREGQIIAGAAIRWAILDNGTDYILRIGDDAGISADTVARRLRAAFRRRAASPERGLIGAISSVSAVTTTVVELRLDTPQPDLLPILASADYALGARGTMQAAAAGPSQALIVGRRVAEDQPATRLMVRAEPIGKAVARFAAGDAALVLGGTFADLAVARASDPRRAELRFDPVAGLFGFVLRDASGPAADPSLREALSLAIDRDRQIGVLDVPGLAKATTLAASAIEPPLAARRARALALLARRDAGRPLRLRIAMPDGPGSRLLFALIARDWAQIGIGAIAVPADAPADLALIDLVLPPGSRAAFACGASAGCDPKDPLALLAPPYIPLASPLRWSLVRSGTRGFVENALAAHPLDQLNTVR